MKRHLKTHMRKEGKKFTDKDVKSRKRLSDVIKRGVSVFLSFSVLVSTSYAENKRPLSKEENKNWEKIAHENHETHEYEFEYFTTIVRTIVQPDTSYWTSEEWVYAYGNDTEPIEPINAGSDTFVVPDEFVDDSFGMKYYVVNYEYVKMDYDEVVASGDTASTTMFDIYADRPGYEDWYLENIFYLSPEYDTIVTLRAFVSCLDEDGWPRTKYFGFAYPEGGGFSWSIAYGYFQRRSVSVDEKTKQEEDKVKVYPTPASQMLFVELGKETENVRLYDVTGRCVLDVKGSGLLALDVSELNSGVYLLVVGTKEKKEVRKVHVLKN